VVEFLLLQENLRNCSELVSRVICYSLPGLLLIALSSLRNIVVMSGSGW